MTPWTRLSFGRPIWLGSNWHADAHNLNASLNCNLTVTTHSSSKNLEEMDWVGDVVKGRVLTEGATEAGPNVPGCIAPSVVLSSDSGAGRCLCLADISKECMFGLSWHNCQG